MVNGGTKKTIPKENFIAIFRNSFTEKRTYSIWTLAPLAHVAPVYGIAGWGTILDNRAANSSGDMEWKEGREETHQDRATRKDGEKRKKRERNGEKKKGRCSTTNELINSKDQKAKKSLIDWACDTWTFPFPEEF